VTLVDQIGIQLDALGVQLEHIEPLHPAAVETRKLVGRDAARDDRRLPQDPRALRQRGTRRRDARPAAGREPRQDQQRDRHVTRQLADGALDDLAIRTRYLDYRYGAAGEPSALPRRAGPIRSPSSPSCPTRDKQES
jgi:hypothetical protein